MKIKLLLKSLLPPLLLKLLMDLKNNSIKFEGDYPTWDKANSFCSGYSSDLILTKVKNATLTVKSGEGAYERDSLLFMEIEYSWQVTSSLMWAAARFSGVLNVLDFGGALGSTYYQNRLFLRRLSNVTWSIIEQPNFVEVGSEFFEDDNLKFYKKVSECVENNSPNIILLSSVMQYLESPYDVFEELSSLGASVLVVDRTPFYFGDEDKIVVQKVPASIYKASYPMRVFSRDKFLKFAENHWNLVDEKLALGGNVKATNGITISFLGMIFEAKK
jgi:putative methyltransferase (TIGR04325 family)